MMNSNIRQATINEQDRKYFELLEAHRADPLYFKRFIKKDKQQRFPVGHGYPIISTECIEPNCIMYIPYEQLNFSILPQIQNGQKVRCRNKMCNAVYSLETLRYEGDLEALFEHNFTVDDKNRLGTVLISSDYQVIAERDESWNRLMKQVDRTRLERLTQLIPQLKEHENNGVSEQTIKVNTKQIYDIIQKEMNDFPVGALSKEISEKTKDLTHRVIDTCMLYKGKDRDKYKIWRYFEQSSKRNIVLSLVDGPDPKDEKLTLAYDKKDKNIFMLSHNGNLYHTNTTTRIDVMKEGVRCVRLGKILIPKDHKVNESNLWHCAMIFHNGYLYLVGGKMYDKYVKYVYRIQVSRYLSEKNVDVIIPLIHCYNLKKERATCGVSIDGDKIVVCGGCAFVIKYPISPVNNVEIIDTTKIKDGPNKPVAQEVLSGPQFNLGSCAISRIEPGRFAIYGGNSDCQMASTECENRLIKIFDLKKGVLFKKQISNHQGLQFTNMGNNDGRNDGTVVFMRTLLSSGTQFSFVKVEKVDEDNYIVLHDIKTFEL